MKAEANYWLLSLAVLLPLAQSGESATSFGDSGKPYLASSPFYTTYVDSISTWWGNAIAQGIGATDTRGYNLVNLAFWIPNQDGSSSPADVAQIWANIGNYGITSYGSTADEIRKNLRQAYHNQSASVLVSAFGGTSFPTSYGVPAVPCGENLAQFVIDNQLDGVDLDYEDNKAMQKGTAVPWLINMTEAMLKKFAATGKQYIITHAPQAPYFMDGKYPQNYVDLHRTVLSDGTSMGDHINSYNVQFYNQVSSEYSNYTTLFVKSDGWSAGTALQQIADKGIPIEKISLGKPVTTGDVSNTGYVPVDQLAGMIEEARAKGPWSAKFGGVMGWQFHSDPNGDWISKLKQAINNTPNDHYVDKISTWEGNIIAREIGANDTRGYNLVNLAFWIPNQDGSSRPADIAYVWANIGQYGVTSYGSTADEIRKNLRQAYHNQNASVLVSAFGSTSWPTTQGVPANACGDSLAQFVIDNQLDGVDLDYEDNAAMQIGTAVPWLINMTEAMLKKFATTGEQYIITHAPQAPYFMDGKYPKNYVDLHRTVLSDGTSMGDHINSYNVQFYNQGTSDYSNYTSLFVKSGGWSAGTALQQIADKGIPIEKISLGKPVTTGDVSNTGYVPPDQLAGMIEEARAKGPWSAKVGGVMGWQFSSDPNGDWISKLKQAINN